MRSRSESIYKSACEVIPGGVNSPVRSFRHFNMTPLIVESGAGSRITDVDGKEYIDYCGSWGSLILGHAHPQIVKASCDQLARGSSFGISTPIEEKIARKVVSLMPHVEKLRFVNSGTEATMTAMRLARGYTEKPKIIKFTGHYHGHSDALLVQAGSGVTRLNPSATSKGVNQTVLSDTLCFPFNDLQELRSFFRTSPIASQVAGVILEPVTGNMGVVPGEADFFAMLREETKRVGALLIFDEVITGFRLGLEGAQGLYGIEPDLTCLGKVIGGGFPVAAVGGKAKILDQLAPLGGVYQAGTLSGNPVAMRAGLETLCLIEQEGFYEELQRKTDLLTLPILDFLKRKKMNACLQQAGSLFSLFFGVGQVRGKEDLKNLDEAIFCRFFQFLLERGIYLSPSAYEACFLSSAHTEEEIAFTRDAILEFLQSL